MAKMDDFFDENDLVVAVPWKGENDWMSVEKLNGYVQGDSRPPTGTMPGKLKGKWAGTSFAKDLYSWRKS